MTIVFSWTSWEFWVLVVLLIVAIVRNGSDLYGRDLFVIQEDVEEIKGKLDSILDSLK
jgi:hypothetical protein